MERYQKDFEAAEITYEHRLIDDMAAQMIKSKGGMVIALKSKWELKLPDDDPNRNLDMMEIFSQILLLKDLALLV